MIVERDRYLRQLIDGRENGLVKVVTGLRRSGKTVLLFELFRSYLRENGIDDAHIIAIRLDEQESEALHDSNALLAEIKSRLPRDGMTYVLLDEIQLAAPFEGVMNSLLNIRNVDVYVTGSNSKMLSSDVATSFRGRSDNIHVSPFLFKEFLKASGLDSREGWREYSTYGGLPQLLTLKTQDRKEAYLADLWTRTYQADLVEHNKLKNPELLDSLLNVTASYMGSLTNPHKLTNAYNSSHGGKGTNDNTVSAYLGFLEDAFIVEKAVRYDVRGKAYLSTPQKYYFTDVGLRNSRLKYREMEENRILENVVWNEVKARGWKVDVGVVPERTAVGGKRENVLREVDFVCNKVDTRMYVQVALELPDRAKYEQESASLMGIKDSFQKIIVVKSLPRGWTSEDGIMVMDILGFLDYLDRK